MPFVERIVLSREKESIPLWNKVLQGYYDSAGISSDNFDQAVRVGIAGDAGQGEVFLVGKVDEVLEFHRAAVKAV